MRENIGLFKAKDIITKEWREGYYWTNELGNHFIRVIRDKNNNFITPIDYEIDPETICEFTGLTDKNGKKIFEGDIVRIDNGKSYKPRYSLLSVDWEINGFYYNSIIDNLYRNYDLGKSQAQDIFEVIGNKFDNPELLEVRDE